MPIVVVPAFVNAMINHIACFLIIPGTIAKWFGNPAGFAAAAIWMVVSAVLLKEHMGIIQYILSHIVFFIEILMFMPENAYGFSTAVVNTTLRTQILFFVLVAFCIQVITYGICKYIENHYGTKPSAKEN